MKTSKKLLYIFIAVFTLVIISSCSSNTGDASALYDFQIKLDGDTYSLPENISKFTDNGWKFPDTFTNFEKSLSKGTLEQTYLEKDEDNCFNIEIFNYTGNEVLVKDCPIGRIIYNFEGDIEVYTGGDFLLNGKTVDEVIARYGEPYSNAKIGNYIEVIYDKDPSESIYDRYVFKFDAETEVIENIDITCFD